MNQLAHKCRKGRRCNARSRADDGSCIAHDIIHAADRIRQAAQ